jgi:hypothetical protein
MKMKVEVRADSVHIEGYVNAVERDSKIINVLPIGQCVEQIRAGAFGQALRDGVDVEILENHNFNRKLGSIAEGNLKLSEDTIGLRAAADIYDNDVIDKARRGLIKGWSFGFVCKDDKVENRADNVPRRIVNELDLKEVSLIDGNMTPCYVGTLVEVRGQELVEIRDFVDDEIETVDETAEGTAEEERAKPDYSYYDAVMQLLELRYNPYHDPSNGRFTSGGGGGGGAVLMIPKGHKGVYKGYKKELAKSSMAAGKMAAERIKAMGGDTDEYGNYNYAKHGGLKRFSGVGSQTPSATIDVQTGNVASQATNSGNGLTNSGNSGTMESAERGSFKTDIATFKKSKVAYKEVQMLETPLAESEIIEKLGGGDRTKGSCVSVAYAYAANKAGYDVTDYRGGESQEIMSSNNRYRIGGLTDSVAPNNSFLKSMTPGQKMKFLKTNISEGDEYVVSAARHCAVVKKDGGKLYYLELQQEPGVRYTNGIGVKGWKPMTKASTMSERFGDKKRYGRYSGMTMIKVSDLPKAEGFREMMGYINTAADKQQKGYGGYAK